MRRPTLLAVALTAVLAAPAQAALKAPALESPASGADVESPPIMSWKPVSGAVGYTFQVAADRAFGSVVDKGSFTTKNTSATIPGKIPDGEYFWRVRAIDSKKNAGRWSSTRSFDKVWATAPGLLEPADQFGVKWPGTPLVLRWTEVPHATRYIVQVATDPSLAQLVVGSVKDPADTQGQALALPGTLNAGTYYWAVTPVDAEGHRGRRSAVGRFTWGWDAGTTVSVQDLNPAEEVFDPLLTWTPVAGAARYDVEVNTTADFAPGSKFYGETVIGTAVAPKNPVPNNRYYWRVRAVDASGRAGGWSGGEFRKEFDDADNFTPPRDTVTNVQFKSVDEATGNLQTLPLGSTASKLFMTWDPVPGAAQYEYRIHPYNGSICDYGTNVIVDEDDRQTFLPAANLMAEGAGPPSNIRPGPTSWPGPQMYGGNADTGAQLSPGDYCVRILARDGAGTALGTKGNDSEWTYVNGFQQKAFTYTTPTPAPETEAYMPMPQANYRLPGGPTTRTPYLTWKPIPEANGYWVILSRDDSLTEVIQVGWTRRPFFVPTKTVSDEDTSYYWVVFPTGRKNGSFPSIPPGKPFASFVKQSVQAATDGPAGGASQPIFRWSAVEGAERYRVQVASDPTFRDPIDDVTTHSTAYASSTTYPVDTDLYWRVRAEDANKIQLRWSEVRSFRRTLPTPVTALDNPIGGETIPVLSWLPVEGAVSYDLHVDQADGTSKDFTLASTRFTPTTFYGSGIWRWKVRANFPTLSSKEVGGPYSAPVDYLRRILPPDGPRQTITSSRVHFSWLPDLAAKEYKVQVSKTDSFTDNIESVEVKNPVYAPKLDRRGYEDGGSLKWRVAVVDAGNNVGAWRTGSLKLPERINVKVSGLARRGRTKSITVRVTTLRGSRLRNVTIRPTGVGLKVKAKKTGKKGQVTFRIRPRKKGTLTFTASRKGYKTSKATQSIR